MSLGAHSFEISESDRQVILLAIAELSLRRPGWNYMLTELAKVFHGEAMYDGFKKTSGDSIKPPPAPDNASVLVKRCEHDIREDLCGICEIAATRYTISPDGKSITCLTCGKTSWNLNDVEKRYCGHCHTFHELP